MWDKGTNIKSRIYSFHVEKNFLSTFLLHPPSCFKLKAHNNLFLYNEEKGKNKTKNPTKTLTMSPLQKQKQKQNQGSNLLTFLEIKPKFPLIDCRLPNMQRIHTPKSSCVSKTMGRKKFCLLTVSPSYSPEWLLA